MRSAATRLQEMFNHLIPAWMSRAPIDLAAGIRQRMHYTYQQASILSYAPYRLGALPQEQVLASDLRSLVGLYDAIVSDPLEATVDQLVEAVATPASSIETITVSDFEPRPPSNAMASASIDKRTRRYSPESRKVGDAGERIVVRHEQERLARIGRQDLADRVRCHGQEKEFLGWDITSFDEGGKEVFIEVKSSIGKYVSCVHLTGNEWDAARKRSDGIATISISLPEPSLRPPVLSVCATLPLTLMKDSWSATRLPTHYISAKTTPQVRLPAFIRRMKIADYCP